MPQNKIPKLLAGDIILSRSDSLVSKLIRWAGKRMTGSARVSHAALSLGDLTEDQEIIESLWKVSISPLAKYTNQRIIIYRMKGLTARKRREIATRTITVFNHSYGLLKIPLFLLDCLTNSYFFTSMFGVSNFKVCSNLVAWSYEKVLHYEVFNAGWRSIQPDTIDDFCRNNKEWEIIYDSLQDPRPADKSPRPV